MTAAGIAIRSVLIGTFFGFVLTKGEAVSWFRIQEMFRFQSFHMYGIIGSAVLVGAVALWWMRRSRRFDDADGRPAGPAPKDWKGRNYRYWLGGTVFGLGWGLLGACPGPIYALIGAGYTVFLVPLAAAVLGTWAYGVLRPRLPHH